MLKRIFPFLKWSEGYNSKYFRSDFIAGLTVALVLIPQSMAYAQLAGLPAYYGLYAAFLPPLIASLFGSSRQLATGPVAVVSLMTSASLEPLATAGSEAFIAYAILLAIMVGLFQFLLGALRLGIVVNLLSHPVIMGFTNAAAIIIATSQLSKIFGVYVDKAEHHYETIYRVIVAALNYTHLPTLGLAILAFAIMIISKRINPKIPNVLIAALVTILISWIFSFENKHKTELSMIQSPEVRNTIEKYNNALEEIEAVSRAGLVRTVPASLSLEEVNSALSAQDLSRICYGCHTAKEFASLDINIRENSDITFKELIRLIHDADLHDRHITLLNEKCPQNREQIRNYHFEAVESEGGNKIFFLEGHVPEQMQSDGSIWRT